MNKNLKGNLDIYLDGPTEAEIIEIGNVCDGYTFNPSLFRSLGVKNYLDHCIQLSQKITDKPISLEVIADDGNGMIKQANVLNNLGPNIWIKIPVSFCNGQSTKNVIKELMAQGLKLNITAIFTLDQIKEISNSLDGNRTILSIFAGRIFDLGLDACEIIEKIVVWNNQNISAKILWASPRMVYDIINANKTGCDIITIPPSILKKTDLWGLSPLEYSLKTVQMFYNDANASGYKFG